MSLAEEVEMTTRVLAPYIKILPSCASCLRGESSSFWFRCGCAAL